MAGDSKITEEIWNGWLEPFQATKLLVEAGIETRVQAISWLKARLRLGEVRAAGVHFELDRDFNVKRTFVGGYRQSVWRNIDLVDAMDDFWISGDFEADTDTMWSIAHRKVDNPYFDIKGEQRVFEHSLCKARFDPKPIEAFCRKAVGSERAGKDAAEQGGPLEAHKVVAPARGAKRKEWWDHLWIEMIRRVRAGTLTPATQADLQRLLEDYASFSLGIEPGDSTLKPMASNLFKYLKEIDGENGEN